MIQLKKLYEHILEQGTEREDRTGTGTLSIFDSKIQFDLREGFPAVTTKKLAWRAVVGELLWFVEGSTNVERLRQLTHGLLGRQKTIWDANYETQAIDLGYKGGELGPVYGAQWRAFGNYTLDEFNNLIRQPGSVDQLASLLVEAKKNPTSRRLLLSAWNPMAVDLMALPPCHWSFELYIDGDYLDLKWHQRSADAFLGLPFNIASYALLAHILAKLLDKKPRKLVGDLSNVHIYKDHVEQVKLQLSRNEYKLPELSMPEFSSIRELSHKDAYDFKLIDYLHHDTIKAKMAV